MKGMLKYRRVLCAAIALTVFALLAVPAFASTNVYGHEYAPVSIGTSKCDNRMVSTITVSKNPDNAALRIKQEFQSGTFKYPVVTKTSPRGALECELSGIIPNVVEYYPDSIYVTYDIFQGTDYGPYVWYRTYSVN